MINSDLVYVHFYYSGVCNVYANIDGQITALVLSFGQAGKNGNAIIQINSLLHATLIAHCST